MPATQPLTPYLQQQADKAANQGKPGYDVLGDPIQGYKAPTIGSAYGGISTADQGLNDTTAYYKSIADTPVDEQAIRDATMKRLQTEIDATNGIYAEKLRQAHIAGENRLGSAAASEGRSGLLGSDFGAAQTSNVNNDNSAIYSGIDQERGAKLASITNQGIADATAEIAAKRTAQTQGADAYIKFLTSSNERQQLRSDNAAKAALAGGVDLSSDAASLKSIAAAYQIDPNTLSSSFVAAKNAAAAAEKASTIEAPITSSVLKPDGKGGYTTVQQGQATPDSALKEYQYAVQNDGYTGSLSDWNAEKANQKVSLSVTHDPITGALQTTPRTGPDVAGTGAKLPAAPTGSTTLPSKPAASGTAAVPPKGDVADPFAKLSGSDLAYAQSGNPTQAKFKYPGQVDAAAARIQALIPGWTPANAAAQFAFFKSPDTQKFIANSNTVLNTINDPKNGIKALSHKVDRTAIVIGNNGLLALNRATSDPATANFVQQANLLADEIGKILGSGTGSDFTIQLGQTLVNPAYSQSTFDATMDNLDARVRNKITEYYAQAGQTNPNASTASAPTGTPKGAMDDRSFVQQSLQAQNANYSDVISRTPPGQIPVLLNSSGQIGYLPTNEFDPGEYTKL